MNSFPMNQFLSTQKVARYNLSSNIIHSVYNPETFKLAQKEQATNIKFQGPKWLLMQIVQYDKLEYLECMHHIFDQSITNLSSTLKYLKVETNDVYVSILPANILYVHAKRLILKMGETLPASLTHLKCCLSVVMIKDIRVSNMPSTMIIFEPIQYNFLSSSHEEFMIFMKICKSEHLNIKIKSDACHVSCFIKCIHDNLIPFLPVEQIESLNISHYNDEPLPSNLQSLCIDECKNLKKLPGALKFLRIQKCVKFELDEFPHTLQTLILGDYNEPLSIPLPYQLSTLKMKAYNHVFPPFVYTLNGTFIKYIKQLDHDLTGRLDWCLPNLLTLKLSSYNQVITHLPDTLIDLDLRAYQHGMIKLPSNLQRLRIGK